MSAQLVIKKYTQALFAACEETKKTELVAGELSQVAKVFSEKDIAPFFQGPFNTNDNKAMVTKSALEGKCSPELFNFVIMLLQNDRVGLIAEINEAFQLMVRAKGGETEGTLSLVNECSEEFKSQVEAKVSKILNKKVKLGIQKDTSLLSGYKVTVGGWTIDDSAQFHLNKIKEEILKRGM